MRHSCGLSTSGLNGHGKGDQIEHPTYWGMVHFFEMLLLPLTVVQTVYTPNFYASPLDITLICLFMSLTP